MRYVAFFSVLMLFLSACAPQPEVLPTVADLSLVVTQQAATNAAIITEQAPTATATRGIPTLPPTFTPTFTPTSEPTLDPTPTPEGFSEAGTLIYLYNGDSIAAVNADGSDNRVIMTFGAGLAISDIAVSPDGQLIAFVGPFEDKREVYVTNRTGNYLQRISCLRYADVRQPTWATSGEFLTFFAAPSVGTVGNIYRVNLDGANACPVGNDQRILVNGDSNLFRGMAWNRLDNMLIYGIGDGPLYFLDLRRSNIAEFSSQTAFGPDSYPLQNPTTNQLVYLATIQDPVTGRTGGGWVIVDQTSTPPVRPWGLNGRPPLIRMMRWSRDGEQLLLMSADSLISVNARSGAVAYVVENATAPMGDFSPDGREVAYTVPDASNVPQIYLKALFGDTTPRQLTNNPDGVIGTLFWLP